MKKMPAMSLNILTKKWREALNWQLFFISRTFARGDFIVVLLGNPTFLPFQLCCFLFAQDEDQYKASICLMLQLFFRSITWDAFNWNPNYHISI